MSWLYFNDEPRVQERQRVKEQQSCISIFKAYPTIPSDKQEYQPRYDNSIQYMAAWQIYRCRATSGERNLIEQIKTPMFLEALLPAEIMQEPQSNLEEKINSGILKYNFSSRTDSSIFTSIVTKIRFKFRSQVQLLAQIRCVITFTVVSSAQIAILQIKPC